MAWTPLAAYVFTPLQLELWATAAGCRSLSAQVGGVATHPRAGSEVESQIAAAAFSWDGMTICLQIRTGTTDEIVVIRRNRHESVDGVWTLVPDAAVAHLIVTDTNILVFDPRGRVRVWEVPVANQEQDELSELSPSKSSQGLGKNRSTLQSKRGTELSVDTSRTKLRTNTIGQGEAARLSPATAAKLQAKPSTQGRPSLALSREAMRRSSTANLSPFSSPPSSPRSVGSDRRVSRLRSGFEPSSPATNRRRTVRHGTTRIAPRAGRAVAKSDLELVPVMQRLRLTACAFEEVATVTASFAMTPFSGTALMDESENALITMDWPSRTMSIYCLPQSIFGLKGDGKSKAPAAAKGSWLIPRWSVYLDTDVQVLPSVSVLPNAEVVFVSTGQQLREYLIDWDWGVAGRRLAESLDGNARASIFKPPQRHKADEDSGSGRSSRASSVMRSRRASLGPKDFPRHRLSGGLVSDMGEGSSVFSPAPDASRYPSAFRTLADMDMKSARGVVHLGGPDDPTEKTPLRKMQSIRHAINILTHGIKRAREARGGDTENSVPLRVPRPSQPREDTSPTALAQGLCSTQAVSLPPVTPRSNVDRVLVPTKGWNGRYTLTHRQIKELFPVPDARVVNDVQARVKAGLWAGQ